MTGFLPSSSEFWGSDLCRVTLLNDDQVRDLPLVGKIEWKTLIFFLCFHFKLYVSTISPGNQNLLPVLAYIFMPLMYV